jgi:metallophosphoesterase superfamily enzyme|tara:strand:+ start:13443 stop:14180 length:738 start_codon:yes stop_codon:yes gene_type:complete
MSKKSKKSIKDVRPRLSGAKLSNFNFFNNDESRVLVVGDLHSPFDLDSYFDHCVEVYERYNCNRVVFIGDVIDNHYSSYHETDADGLGGGQELELAIKRLERYYHRFPDAHVTVGNHDRIIMRKAQSGGVPKEWIKDYQEVLRTPGWKYVTDVEIDGVLYIHGEAGTAKTKARADMRSTVQGHLHTQAYTEYFVGANSRVFGTQVGCGIDAKSYAMAYMKVGKKPAIGCAVVLGGKTAINELMVL